MENLFETNGKTPTGAEYRFLHVQIKNVGRHTARACKVFVRNVTLIDNNDREVPLLSERLMRTNWVPREADLFSVDIPSNLDFLADIVRDFEKNGRRIAIPIF